MSGLFEVIEALNELSSTGLLGLALVVILVLVLKLK